MKKRILALLLTLALLVSVVPAAFAAGVEVTAKVAGDTNVVKAGEAVSVEIAISGNPGIAYADWQLYYDNTAFEFVDYTEGVVDPTVNDTEEGGLPCVWATFFEKKNVEGDGVLFTVNFKAKTDAYNGEYQFKIDTVGMGDANDTPVEATYAPAPVVITGGKDADPLPALTLDQTAFTYDATAKTVVAKIEGLVADKDYTVSGELTGTAAKTYTVTATGKGHYQGTQTATWTIAPAEITVSGITATDRAYVKGNKEVAVDASAMTVAGKIGSDDVAVKVAEKAEIAAADAGTYDVALNVALEGTAASNYVLAEASQKTASVTIAKAAGQALKAPEKGLLFSNTTPVKYGVEEIAGIAADAGVTAVTAVSISGSDKITAELFDGAVNVALVAGLTEADEGAAAEVVITYTSKNYEDSTVKVPVKVINKFDISDKIVFAAGTGVYTGEAYTHETATTEVTGGEWSYEYVGNMTDAGTHKVIATYETADSVGSVEVEFVITAAELAAPTATITKVYDGTATAAAEQVKVETAAAEYTVAVKSDYVSADVAASAGKVQVEITLTGMTANNYNFANGTDVIVIEADGKITAKAIAAEAAVTGSYTYTGSEVKAAVTVTSSEATLTEADYVVAYKNNIEAGEAAAVVTSAADSNYKFSAETTFEIAKGDATVTDIIVSKECDGEELDGEDILYSAIFNGNEISGEWTITGAEGEWEVGEYTVTLKFVPENKNLNEVTVENVAAVIEKGTLGYSYTPVSKSGTTFAELDFAFCTAAGIPVEGTLTWFDGEEAIENPEEAKIEANKEYTFKFVPNDTENYKALEDTLVLYAVTVDGYPTNVIITASSKKHGSVSVNPAAPEAGDKVVINVKPDAGYAVEDVVVRDESGKELKVVEAANNKFIFVMPVGQVTVKVSYDKDTVKFLDVADNAWYAGAVYEAVDMGLFTGVSENYFQPDGSMTREMLVTVLWRLEGSPAAGSSDFADVANGSWYAEAVAWASAEGIVNGISDTQFAPNASITREQMATMLFRYAKYLGLNTSARADLSDYADAGKISAYAEDAMAWAVASGLINGVTATTLNPAGTATRAQVATILVRFVGKFL